MKARNLVPGGPDREAWADEFRAKSLGVSSDYLAGPRTIAELEDNETPTTWVSARSPLEVCRLPGISTELGPGGALLGVALGKLKFALLVSEPGHLVNG